MLKKIRWSYTPEYKAWHSMIKRCYDPNNQAYKNYGGRGITVYEEWQENFINFYNDMGERPSGFHSLDRINNDGNYEPENCRWATYSTQNSNRRQQNKTHCKRGHELTKENSLIRYDRFYNEYRVCKFCTEKRVKEYNKKYRLAQKQTTGNVL